MSNSFCKAAGLSLLFALVGCVGDETDVDGEDFNDDPAWKRGCATIEPDATVRARIEQEVEDHMEAFKIARTSAVTGGRWVGIVGGMAGVGVISFITA